ncbi:hypothetical protein L0152_09290 [bacterium]|nr:hypothetical protein [bacterium]
MTHQGFTLFAALAVVLGLLLQHQVTLDAQSNLPSSGIALNLSEPDLETMVGVSPCIFTGMVTGLRFGQHKGSKDPFTFVRFGGVEFIRNESNLTLDSDKSIEISYMGGVLENFQRIEISEQPEFKLGGHYLVFVRGGEWRMSPVPGSDRGVFMLKGSMKGDPFVLDIDGNPITSFQNGYPVHAQKQPLEKRQQDGREAQEQEIAQEKAKSMKILSVEKLSAEEVNKKEEDLRKKEVEEKLEKENDQPSRFSREYPDALKLSSFVKEIRALTEKSRGKYPAFSRISLTPVPRPSDQKLQSPVKQ